MNEDCNKGVWRLQTHRMEAPKALDGGSKRGGMEAPNGKGLGTYVCSSNRKKSIYKSRINLINYLFALIRANLF